MSKRIRKDVIEPPVERTVAAKSPDDKLKAAVAEANELRAKIRFDRGGLRREWNNIKESQTPGNSTDVNSNDANYDDIESEKQTGKLPELVYKYSVSEKIENIVKKFIDAIASGSSLFISSSELRDICLPKGDIDELVSIIVSAIARVELNGATKAERIAPTIMRLPAGIPEGEKYATWSKVNGRSIVKFFEEGWPAPFIKAGILTRPTLFTLDRSAYKAMTNFTDRGNALPEHLRLPTRSDVVSEELSHVDKVAIRDAERLAAAQRRRSRGNS